VKVCHQRGIRVVLDVVMNFFSPSCPLADLALDRFSVPAGTDGRKDWAQHLFRFDTPSDDGTFAGRDFLLYMGEFWTSEFHVDGFRIDDFSDIRNWDFAQEFTARTSRAAQLVTPGKPFIVVAEDTRRDFSSTNPHAYHDTDAVSTTLGQASRSDRLRHLISKDGVWNQDYGHGHFDPGYADLANSVNYVTSHDVADAPRMMNYVLGSILREQALGPGDVEDVRATLDTCELSPGQQSQLRNSAVNFALYRIFGVFAVLLTSVGIPMFLAGEEFADVHDLNHLDDEIKQQDPVQFRRAMFTGNSRLQLQISRLINLRTTHPALQRNEVDLFYWHPEFDDNDGARVFGYTRTGGDTLGSSGQVVVLGNMGASRFPSYDLAGWPWAGQPIAEVATMGPITDPPAYGIGTGSLSLGLDAFQVHVFTT
jgi:glycosidase